MGNKVSRVCFATALFFALLVLSGCQTETRYVGHVNLPLDVPQAREAPLPIQLIVDAPEKPGRTIPRDSLTGAFFAALRDTKNFQKVSLRGSELNPSLTCLYADVDMEIMMYCSTPAWYVVTWILIFPMFLPLNEISAEGDASITIRDEHQELKKYSLHCDEQSMAWRNSVGLAHVKKQMAVSPSWSAPIVKNLIDDLLQAIIDDTATFERALQVQPKPREE
jgi:hypothetical protein